MHKQSSYCWCKNNLKFDNELLFYNFFKTQWCESFNMSPYSIATFTCFPLPWRQRSTFFYLSPPYHDFSYYPIWGEASQIMADLPGHVLACLHSGKLAFLAILVSGGIVLQILVSSILSCWPSLDYSYLIIM